MDACCSSTNEFIQLLLQSSEFLSSVLLQTPYESIDKTYKSSQEGKLFPLFIFHFANIMNFFWKLPANLTFFPSLTQFYLLGLRSFVYRVVKKNIRDRFLLQNVLCLHSNLHSNASILFNTMLQGNVCFIILFTPVNIITQWPVIVNFIHNVAQLLYYRFLCRFQISRFSMQITSSKTILHLSFTFFTVQLFCPGIV